MISAPLLLYYFDFAANHTHPAGIFKIARLLRCEFNYICAVAHFNSKPKISKDHSQLYSKLISILKTEKKMVLNVKKSVLNLWKNLVNLIQM